LVVEIILLTIVIILHVYQIGGFGG